VTTCGAIAEGVPPVLAISATLVLLRADELVELSVDRRLGDLAHELSENVVRPLNQNP
jgi:hypothetical protein